MPESCALRQWSSLMLEAAVVLKRPLNTCGRAKHDLAAAGFVDIVEIPFRWPMNRWPKEKKYKELGMWTQENFVSGVEAMSLALFTRGLGWTYEEVVVFVARVRADMKDGGIHAYWPIYVVYGRKP
jgi:hypothetical protein